MLHLQLKAHLCPSRAQFPASLPSYRNHYANSDTYPSWNIFILVSLVHVPLNATQQCSVSHKLSQAWTSAPWLLVSIMCFMLVHSDNIPQVCSESQTVRIQCTYIVTLIVYCQILSPKATYIPLLLTTRVLRDVVLPSEDIKWLSNFNLHSSQYRWAWKSLHFYEPCRFPLLENCMLVFDAFCYTEI